MANDINKAISGNQIKNGTTVVTTTVAGEYSTIDTYVKNTPTISDIEDKYDNRFYNGIFVQLVGDQTVIGG
jgi:hypothetical protein